MVLLSSNRMKLRRKIVKGSKRARLMLNMINDPRWYLATTSTGTNLLVIMASIVSAVWFEHLFGAKGELLTILIISPFLLMFGEIIPRTIFQQKADELAIKIAYPLYVASKIISPVTFFVYWLSKLFYRNVDKEHIGGRHFVSRDELELILNIFGKDSDVKKSEKKLLHKVFHLSKSTVEDVMVPLINVVAVPHTATVKEAIKTINQTGYSRLPVYNERIDNLIGIVHAFDLIDVSDMQHSIMPYIHDVPYVPELKRADDLLVTLQKTRNSIAIVVDEYGGAVGIVTIEDILEEVVGEIQDEFDGDVREIVRLNPHTSFVNARMEIETINELLGLNIPQGDYDTIGGFLLKQMGKIPQKGETFIYNSIRFTIRQASKRAIYEIMIEKLDHPSTQEDSVQESHRSE